MKLAFYTVFAVTSFVIEKHHYYVLAQYSEQISESEEEIQGSTSFEHESENGALLKRMLDHTFVAIIDVAFTDGSKRTCTGTIIHDNVLLTARHCFSKHHDKYTHPELSNSFIVIGSKKMFETGYEQYLPIERIISHPKYKGWTADIALVHTFAGMISEKHGTLMPLAEEKMSTPDSSNVTVLSWGLCNKNYKEEDSHSNWKKRSRFSQRAKNIFSSSEEAIDPKSSNKNPKTKLKYSKSTLQPKIDKQKRNKSHNKKYSDKEEITKRRSKYQGSSEDAYSHSLNADDGNNDYEQTEIPEKFNYDSFYKNWRRSMGTDNNKLTVETFGFIDVQTCKEMVKKVMPDKYKLRNVDEYVCYASEDHYITDEDAGAPAVRHGRLVAVTIGGVESNGDHVAVGIKVSCFCPWIADNLPDKGKQLKCCDNCCNNTKNQAQNKDIKQDNPSRVKKKKLRS